MGDFGGAKDKWVCPNDRELSLRAKLKTGWSVKTTTLNSYAKPQQLSDVEQESIRRVIQRADTLENVEQERVGRLVERLENMKKNAMGNGTTQCILCADEFGLLGASPLLCLDCKKAVCTKCGVDTINAQKELLWLCKICAETREMWKKSGAWFFRGLPKYTLPERKSEPNRHLPGSGKSLDSSAGLPTRTFNTWSQGRARGSSEREYTDSSDDDFKASRISRKQEMRKATTDSVESSDSGVSASGQIPSEILHRTHSPSPPNFPASFAISGSGYDESGDQIGEGVVPSAGMYHEQERHLSRSPVVNAHGTGYIPGSPIKGKQNVETTPERTFQTHARRDSQHSASSYASYSSGQGYQCTYREKETNLVDSSFEEKSPDDASKKPHKKIFRRFRFMSPRKKKPKKTLHNE